MQALQEASFPKVAGCQCTLVLQRAMVAGDTCRYVLFLPLGRLAGDSKPSPIMHISYTSGNQKQRSADGRHSPSRAACWGELSMMGDM